MTRQLLTIVLFSLIIISVNAQICNPKIDSLISAYVVINKFNGSAFVIRDGKKVYEKSYGYQNAALRSLNTKNSIFQIGSLTKSFTTSKPTCSANSISHQIPDALMRTYHLSR
jgi:CubicO group peptidase (beta-lactamase class C family)